MSTSSPPPQPPPRPPSAASSAASGSGSAPKPPPSAGTDKAGTGKATAQSAAAGTAGARVRRVPNPARQAKKNQAEAATGAPPKATAKPTEKKEGGRNTMVTALLAGAFALGGMFLLISSLRGGEATATPVEPQSTVLVVAQPVDQGTTIEQLLANPRLLQAKAVPEQFAAPTAISSAEQLELLGDMMLNSDMLPGEQLMVGNFVARNDFENDSFIDRSIVVETPPGHHQVVLDIPAARALGGNIRPGDVVTVISGFRWSSPGGAGQVEASLVVLNAVEVLNVQSSGLVGKLASEADSVGIATTGDLIVTLAVKSDEVTDLTYAIDFGDIILAAAIDELPEGTERPITVLDSVLTGEDLVLDGSIRELLSSELGGEEDGLADDEEGGEADETDSEDDETDSVPAEDDN